jgi:hypothetical protein
MNERKILMVATLTGAALTGSTMAQTTIYTCNFDNPPYTVGSIDTQQGWVTYQAGALAPGLSSMAISATAGSLAPKSGNGCFASESGTTTATTPRFAVQSGAGAPIVDAINTACAAGAISIEFSCYIVPPTPSTEGTSSVPARHGMVLYTTDSTGVPSKAAMGFQVRASDLQVFAVQWLDVGQLGVTTAGNYLINFLDAPLTLTAGTWNAVGCKWMRETGMPRVRINAGVWTEVIATSTIGYVAKEFDIVNTRGSTSGGAINTVSTVAYMDTLVITASQPWNPTDTDGDGRPDATDNCPDIANWTQADCNNNGIGDVCEIASGNPDFNLDTIPDSCQCLADLFVDGKVSGADLGVLLSQWGPAPAGTVSDINRDGQVSGADLGFLLNAWGPCSN